jgi:hypothetical protein
MVSRASTAPVAASQIPLASCGCTPAVKYSRGAAYLG